MSTKDNKMPPLPVHPTRIDKSTVDPHDKELSRCVLSQDDYEKISAQHDYVTEWVWEHLNGEDCKEFFLALHEKRVDDAYAVVTRKRYYKRDLASS